MLIYVDSVILIYYLDRTDSLHVRASNRLATLQASGDRIAVSDLVRMECRVNPIKLGDAGKLARFDGFFGLPDIETVPLTTPVYDLATEIRARHNFKVPDSLHLAAAVEAGCGAFLTNDARLVQFQGVPVEILA